MPATTRRSVLAVVGSVLASAGCLSDSEATGGTTTENVTTDAEPTTEDTATPDDPTTERPDSDEQTIHAADSPDSDHSLTLRSEASESQVRVRVRVVREATGETVFETTARASPAERTLYNLRQADPEGVESFRMCAELVGTESQRRDCATVSTSACYGDAHVTVGNDGAVRIVYAVC